MQAQIKPVNPTETGRCKTEAAVPITTKMTSPLTEYSKSSFAQPHLPTTEEDGFNCYPQAFHSESALFEHQILYHNKTEFQCKICQFTTSDTPQFRLHVAAHNVTSAAVKAKCSLNNAEIPVFSQLEPSQDDCTSTSNNASLASDPDINFFASSDQIAPKNGKDRRPSTKLPRHPIPIDGRYMCRTPGCDFSTKYEFNLTRHEVGHGKRKGCGRRPKSTKTWRNSNQSKKIKAKENNFHSLLKPLKEPLEIRKSILLSPTKSSEIAAAAKEPTETKPSPPKCAKSVISSWNEDRKNQQNGKNNGRRNDDDDDDDGDSYIKSSRGKYRCKKCYYRTSFKYNMKTHFRTHSNDFPYACHYCNFRTKWEQNVKKHERTQHIDSELVSKVGPQLITSEPIVEGKDNKMEQNSKRRFFSEILEEADGNFYCNKCNYMSNNKRLLISHLKRHSNVRPFPCTFPGCSYRSKWSHWARAHERNVHGFNRFEKVKSNKVRSRPTSGTMELRRFPLGVQIGETVEGASPLTKKLEEPFRKKLEGQVPTKKTYEKLVQSALEMAAGAKAWEKIGCPQCGVKCYPRFLQRHLRVHSDEKPYACAVKGCEYRTKWPGDLKVHMKRHEAALKERQRISAVNSSSQKSSLITSEVVVRNKNNEQRFSSEVSDDEENYIEIYVEPAEELADSTGFACTLCDFVGYSEAAALNHAKSHTQPFFPTAKLNEIPIICLD